MIFGIFDDIVKLALKGTAEFVKGSQHESDQSRQNFGDVGTGPYSLITVPLGDGLEKKKCQHDV